MTDTPQDAILREKILYRYTSAVERGDFETASAILAQAQDDPRLEQMILEVNGALADELPPAPKPSSQPILTHWQRLGASLRRLAPGMGLGALALLLVLGIAALMGPAIGNTFSNTLTSLSTPERAYLQDRQGRLMSQQAAPTTAPAMQMPAATDTPYYHAASQARTNYGGSYPAPQGMPAAAQPTATPYAMSQSAPEAPPVAAATDQPRLVVRNGNLDLTVADTRKARDTVAEIISRYAGEGAFILANVESPIAGSEQPQINMQLRVPVARYDTIMNQLVGLALTVNIRQEQAQDVTSEYVDTQARIKELQTAIDRLLEIESQAKTTDDLLRIERELSDRRAELESYEGRAQYLSQTAALSLIQLQLRPKVDYPTATPYPTPTPAAWRPQETAHRSTLVLLNDLRRFGDWLIVFGITTLPWLAVVGLVAYGGYRLVRRGRK